MEFRLASTRPATNDPFGGGEAVTVHLSEERSSPSEFNLYTESWAPPIVKVSEQLDPFAGLGPGPGAGAGSFEKFKLVNATRRAEDGLPFDGDPYTGPLSSFKLIKLEKSTDDVFDGLPVASAADPETYGTFQKGARKFKVGDKVRCAGHGDRVFEVVKLLPTGTFRCEQEGEPNIAVITFADRMSAVFAA